MCKRMDVTFEGELGWKTPSCSPVPLKSSWRIRLEVVGSIRTSLAGLGSRNRHVTKRGVSFERELNNGHALTAPAAHRPQSWGELTATSFQCLQTWRKLNVPVAKHVSSRWRPDSTIRRKTSANNSVGRRETAACVFWAYLNRLVSLT